MPRHLPRIAGKQIGRDLIAVIRVVAGGALGEVIRLQVKQVIRDLRVFIVAVRSLCEGLWRDQLTAIEPEFEVVTPFCPADIIGDLIGVLNRELGRAGVDTELNAQFIELDRRELVESRKFEVPAGNLLVIAVVAQTKSRSSGSV